MTTTTTTNQPNGDYEINFMDGTKLIYEYDDDLLLTANGGEIKQYIEEKRDIRASALELFEQNKEDALYDTQPIDTRILYCLISPPLKFKEGMRLTSGYTNFIIKEVYEDNIIFDIRHNDCDEYDEDNVNVPISYSQEHYQDYFNYEIYQVADEDFFDNGTYSEDIRMYVDGNYEEI